MRLRSALSLRKRVIKRLRKTYADGEKDEREQKLLHDCSESLRRIFERVQRAPDSCGRISVILPTADTRTSNLYDTGPVVQIYEYFPLGGEAPPNPSTEGPGWKMLNQNWAQEEENFAEDSRWK